ncbi:MAG: C40 family peptidase [Marinobacter sp.]|uniref:C40 family peptidase n=1 Tax=Marinobacter sp. TaxID=50741 RepID=UPI00299E64A5|nr:C40 family peptidase [Marinobacter sp.]MDX1757740.1 C40 family peptidase [Marinobacter sp.]
MMGVGRCVIAGTWSARTALLFTVLMLGGCASQPGPMPTADGPVARAVGEVDGLEAWVRLQRVFERYEGTPYRYGGTGAAGFDCSGFIRAAFREALGRSLPRTTQAMVAMGVPVARDRLQPGDLVFFNANGKNGHAGIFMGDDRFIHASSSQGVTESSLSNRYWQPRFSQARRLLVPPEVAADDP